MMTIASYLLKLFRVIDFAASRILPSMVSYRQDIEELKQSVQVIEAKLDVLCSGFHNYTTRLDNDITTTTKRRATNRDR